MYKVPVFCLEKGLKQRHFSCIGSLGVLKIISNVIIYKSY